ncbi:hypothetical protein Tco_0146117 [Tanacetum coccineum]
MDLTSSLGRIFLGENVYGSSSDKVEGHGDWNAPEYTDTTGSKEKKVTKALTFYKMETDKVSEWYIALRFVNGLEAYDGEINLALDENLISNEYALQRKCSNEILGRITVSRIRLGISPLIMKEEEEAIKKVKAALAVLITRASQSRQHDTLVRLPMDIRLKIDLENQSVYQDVNGSHKSPTKSLFDVGSSRISIFTVTNLRVTLMFWQNHKDDA